MTEIFRVRIVLQATMPIRSHPLPAAELYGLLSNAYGCGAACETGLPETILLEIAEHARTRVRTGDDYAFGLTLLATTPEEASRKLHATIRGLRILGEKPAPEQPVWGGNFRLQAIQDLVRDGEIGEGEQLTPVPFQKLVEEITKLGSSKKLTMRFLSPLRCERGDHHRKEGHEYFDREFFDASSFLFRLEQRAAKFGFRDPIQRDHPRDQTIRASDNQLVWIDMTYGPRARRKSLGGVMGSVALENLSQVAIQSLVLGQYIRCGGNTKFGFGRYRIEQLGAELFPCTRALPLLESALAQQSLSKAAAQFELKHDELAPHAKSIQNGTYHPASHTKILIPKANGEQRMLAIPSLVDRALQRAVNDVIAPGLDVFFEESSLAFRRGLGRERAAATVRKAVREGYSYAVKSDFRQFFDIVNHDELERRLSAYLNEPPLVGLLMTWVKAGSPTTHTGLPTGSPLSPLLANTLLDCFDELIQAEGGRLVRYADDFVILCRSEQAAKELFHSASSEAAQLQLSLNTEKSHIINLRAPFEFLGFRFAPVVDHWEVAGGSGPEHITDIGWEQAAEDPNPPPIRLPGETVEPNPDPDACVVLGPDLLGLYIHDDHLIPVLPGETEVTGIPLQSLEDVILLGSPPVGPGVLAALASKRISVLMADDLGREIGSFLPDFVPDDPDVLLAQASAVRDEVFRLRIARALVAAKLRNYAALADATPPRGTKTNDPLGEELRTLANRAASAPSLETIRGLEGYGARRWYESLNSRLPKGFHFKTRVAPNATDPVNVLLNIAFTHLYRLTALACRSVGLAPNIGLLHERRAGFQALASDLMEPFRHVAERTVLGSLRWISPRDFSRTPEKSFGLMIRPRVAREFAAALAFGFSWPVAPKDAQQARSWRNHLLALARNIRKLVRQPEAELWVPEHAAPTTPRGTS